MRGDFMDEAKRFEDIDKAVLEKIRAAETLHLNTPWPHPGGCEECAFSRLCNVCARGVQRGTSCTNGRCPDCHAAACTPGGGAEHTSGHGFGKKEAIRAAFVRFAMR